MIIASIVEGHGDVQALPVLLRRMVARYSSHDFIEVRKPIRVPKSKLLKQGELERAIELASIAAGEGGAVLIVVDADDDCPAMLANDLLERGSRLHNAERLGVVLAKREFEAWFIASIQSLSGKRGLRKDLMPPSNPEDIRDAKGWISREMEGINKKYSETVDQPAFAALMDLELACAAKSFEKLLRDFRRITSGGKSLTPIV